MGNQRAQFQTRRVARAALVAATVAAAANIGLFLLLHALGVDFMIQPNPATPPASMAVPSFVVATFLPALLAGGLLVLLGRFTTKPRRTFVVIASAVALLSLAGPAMIGGASAGTRLALMVMHLLTAAVISVGLLHSAGSKNATTAANVQTFRTG